MNRVKFSSLEIGQTFIAFSMKMKKINEMGAMTLSERGKRHFIFKRNDLIHEDIFSIFIPKVMSVKVKRMAFSINNTFNGKTIFDLAKEFQEQHYKACQLNATTDLLPLDRYAFSKKNLHDDREDCLYGVFQKTISSLESQIEKKYNFDKSMLDEPDITYLKYPNPSFLEEKCNSNSHKFFDYTVNKKCF